MGLFVLHVSDKFSATARRRYYQSIENRLTRMSRNDMYERQHDLYTGLSLRTKDLTLGSSRDDSQEVL